MRFTPASYRQLAGVTAYYNTRNWHFAYVTADDSGRRVLEVLTCSAGKQTQHPQCRVALDGGDSVGLRVVFDDAAIRFAYAAEGSGGWQDLPVELDAMILSDEHAALVTPGEPEVWGFTGAMIGLWVQDLGIEGGYAEFGSATYRVHG
jgi:xylan 1,4-beta-xylosidase